MTEHQFGGRWTELKLSLLDNYLQAYRNVFTRNRNAQHFTTWYVDGFAGTGARKIYRPDLLLFRDVYEDEATTKVRAGSAQIALKLPAPFDRYLFIERSRRHLLELKETIAREYPSLQERCSLLQGDANDVLETWCSRRDWKHERAVVFLDPYGMQVRWSTVETLAATKAVDMWYLFPLGMGVMRMLTKTGEMEEGWEESLDALFGTQKWRTRFYGSTGQSSFFEEAETKQRMATAEQVKAFLQERLAQRFAGITDGLVLTNSRNFPLYLLCFAAANERGAKIATKIAGSILRPKHGVQARRSAHGDPDQH
jgi:three-Cys-motif partner protein